MNELIAALVAAGVIDRETADLMRRALDPAELQLWAEAELTTAYARALNGQQQRLLDVVRAAGVTATARQLSLFWDGEDERMWRTLEPSLSDIAVEVATVRAIEAAMVERFTVINVTDFDVWSGVNDELLGWVRQHYTSTSLEAFGSVPNLNITSRQQFAQVFEMWQRGDLPQSILDMSTGGMEDLINALQPLFGPERAERIAVTETTHIYARSTQAAADAQPDVTYLRLSTAADERVCPICGPLHGYTRPKNRPYYLHPTLGEVTLPAHVCCRCRELLETDATVQVPMGPEDTYEWQGEL